MAFLELDTLPFKTFFKILKDAKNIHLLGIEDKEEALKVWETIKNEWNEKHPSEEAKSMVEAYKKALYENIKANQQALIIRFLMTYEGNHKEFFEEFKIKWIEDEEKRIEYLLKQANKHKQKSELYQAQLEKIEKETLENKEAEAEDESTIESVNEYIASFEPHGYTINDFDTVTCGKIEAIEKTLKRKALQNGK